jgi:hypothetical protein
MVDLNEILRQMAVEEAAKKAARRKCFISYYGGDTNEVNTFVNDFSDVFIAKVIGVTEGDDFIDSNDSDYVMKRIREKYLGDSTVTICMIGSCTHSRRYIDWELKSTLRQGAYTPNGLIGIILPSLGNSSHLPQRFKENWNKEDESKGYALYRSYPTSKDQLKGWIDSAFEKRTTHAKHISNSQEIFYNNHKCLVHKETH